MSNKLAIYEEKILTYLVENFRKSKKDTGLNKIKRRTQVKPQKFYRKYVANDGNYDDINAINEVVASLEERGFVAASRETFGTQIQNIYLADDKVAEIEAYLVAVYDYTTKDSKLAKMEAVIAQYGEASSICKAECEILARAIAERKEVKAIKDVEHFAAILQAVDFIENNKEDLYIREASMKIYGDSKYLEEQTLKPVCALLQKYAKMRDTVQSHDMITNDDVIPHDGTALNREIADFGREEVPDDKLNDMANDNLEDAVDNSSADRVYDEILLQYHIAKEPTKICVKGPLRLTIGGRVMDISGMRDGIEFHGGELANIEKIDILGNSPKFMTVENKTAYLRFYDENIVTLFLSGFADRYVRDFLKRISEENQNVQWLHFGDIDGGGFFIHRNLCRITGISFALFHMGVAELQNPEFASCLKPLTASDRLRLMTLAESPLYGQTVAYMLEHDVKLEQEIVSLQLMKKHLV